MMPVPIAIAGEHRLWGECALLERLSLTQDAGRGCITSGNREGEPGHGCLEIHPVANTRVCADADNADRERVCGEVSGTDAGRRCGGYHAGERSGRAR